MTADPTRRPSILIVDDTIENLKLMTSMLKERGYEPRPVPSGKLALQALESDPADLILLDINMPEMNGYDVCERLKAEANTRDIPVVFISAMDEVMDKVKAFGVGGSDYVTKPFQYEEVFARVECHLALRRTQRELQRNYEELRELEKLRDGLVHMIVHDMRSPLMVLMANVTLLKRGLGVQLAREHAEEIDMLLQASERLRSMADAVLDVSRLEAGKMPIDAAECDLVTVARSAVDYLKPVYPSQEVIVESPDNVSVVCDGRLMFRVVENLISNGLKHSPRGRPLRVSVRSEPGLVRVIVSDEGPGVPEAYRTKIFEKFGVVQSAGAARRGSVGLGLALCKLAVAAHGGEIGVDSEPGQGSSFWFTLPRT